MALHDVYKGAIRGTTALVEAASRVDAQRPVLLSVFLLVTVAVGIVAFVLVRRR